LPCSTLPKDIWLSSTSTLVDGMLHLLWAWLPVKSTVSGTVCLDYFSLS